MGDVLINKKEGLKRNSLTLQDRLKILERLDAGEQSTQLADDFKVAKSTISRIKKSKDDILKRKTTLETCGGNLDKKRFKGIEDTVLEKSLFDWYCEQKSLGGSINGPALQKKALYFNNLLGGPESFKASPGWLWLFKKRHGIKCSSISVEKSSIDIQASEEFQKKITNLINISGISLDYIYSCSVTELFWKMLPNKTVTSKKEKCVVDKKKPKDRVNVMMCTNASGTHKIPLYVIGQSKIPQCFEGIKKLPMIYEHQHNLQIDKNLMMEWYNNVFIPEVNKKHCTDNNKNVNVILLMENAFSQLTEKEINIVTDLCTVMFFPPNMVSLIRPMDRGIIEEFKKNYRTLLVKRVLAEGVDKILDLFNILDCCTYSAISWSEITASTIKNYWNKLILSENDSRTTGTIKSVDVHNIHFLLSHIPEFSTMSLNATNKWLCADTNKFGEKPRSENNIVHRPFPDANKENFITENSDGVARKPNNEEDSIAITPGEAFKGLSTFINWFRTCDDDSSPVINLMMLEQYRQYVIDKIISSK